MKSRKRFALLAFALLLIGLPCILCVVWVHKEQRQYALNRQLIAALWKNDTRQARILVEAGADPNTREEPSPAPSPSLLIKQILHLAPPQTNDTNSAFLIACGAGFVVLQGSSKTESVYQLSSLDPQLTQTMLLHGAYVHTKYPYGATPLYNTVGSALNASATSYKKDKEIITQLLANGADPDEEENAFLATFGKSPMKTAFAEASSVQRSRPDLVALLRKYRKHP